VMELTLLLGDAHGNTYIIPLARSSLLGSCAAMLNRAQVCAFHSRSDARLMSPAAIAAGMREKEHYGNLVVRFPAGPTISMEKVVPF
jgi:hypothetical protein